MFAPVAFEDLTFPNQALKVWSGFEAQQWMRAGQQFNTTICQYDTTTTRISANYGSGLAKWNTATLAANGFIYSPPHVRTDWCVIDTFTDTVSVTGSVNSSNDGCVYDKISNAVYAFGSGGTKIIPGGVASNISGPPNRQAPGVQSYDGNLLYTVGAFGTTGIYAYNVSANSNASQLASAARTDLGTLGINGKIYFSSGPTTSILEYDPVANTSTTIGTLASDRFYAIKQHPNGFIYVLPANTGTTIKRLNPLTKELIDVLTPSPTYAAFSACIGADGRIYGVSSQTNYISWYDPYSNTNGQITISNGDSSFQGIAVGALGDIYITPWTGGTGYIHKLALVKGSGYVQKIMQEYNMGGRLGTSG
jgi:hypothetical protein